MSIGVSIAASIGMLLPPPQPPSAIMIGKNRIGYLVKLGLHSEGRDSTTLAGMASLGSSAISIRFTLLASCRIDMTVTAGGALATRAARAAAIAVGGVGAAIVAGFSRG